MRRKLGGALLSALLSACGGSAPPANAPSSGSPEDGQGAEPAGYQQPGQFQQQGYPTPVGGSTSTGGFAEPSADALGPTLRTVEEAETALSNAATELDSAGDDCTTACKALASMRRSSQRSCELNGPDDPDQRCKQAEERVEAAEKRVQDRCACTR